MENDKQNPIENENPNQEMDLSNLISGIKRVSADGSGKPAPHNEEKKDAVKPEIKQDSAPKNEPVKRVPADQKKPSSGSSDVPAAKKTPAPASPAKNAGAPVASVKNANAPAASGSKTSSAPSAAPASKKAPSGAPVRRMSEQARKEAEKRRKRASVLLACTAVLLVALIGFGIYYGVSYFLKNKGESSASEVLTSSSQTRGTESDTSDVSSDSSSESSTEPAPSPTPAPTPFPAGGPDLSGYCVVIDAGHQEVANLEQEPMSSSMSGSKDKSSEGFSGVVSGINESEINLSVALVLRDYLQSLGCEVYLTRETNDVDISNKERAELAVSYSPDLYIRLYCNAANDSLQSGCEVIVPGSGKYASDLVKWGENLGNDFAASTGAVFNGCKASTNYSGLNWADSIPSFMLRMGYLTNSDEESLLLDPEYQFTICQGIAQFVVTMPQN